MIGKLALLRAVREDGKPDKLLRDEVRQVIVDTELLVTSADVAATLDEWAEGAHDRRRAR